MKITRKSFQAFFTRASFAGLLLVGGAHVARAQSTAAPAEDRDVLRDLTFDRIFSAPAPSHKPSASADAAWSPVVASSASTSEGERSTTVGKLFPEFGDAAQPFFSPIMSVGPVFSALSSGTLTPTASTYNYSTAPWVITGTGTYPDGGGTATFNAPTTVTPGTLLTSSTITMDVSPDLSQISYNSPFTVVLAAGTGTSIIADPTNGLTLNAANTATNSSTNFFTTFNTISSPISGGGAAGLIKTGNGIVTLTGSNTYTGGTHINGGFLVIHPTNAVGDAVLGATGAGNDIFMNGGTLFTYITGGGSTSRNIILGSSGGTIETDTAYTVNGVISGSGPLLVNGFGGVQLTLTNNNTYTGATSNSLSTAGYMTLSGNGAIAASSSYEFTNFVTLDNSGTTGINRLNDTGAITARGMYLNLIGNGTTATAETVGAITLADGVSTINLTPGTTGTTLTVAGFSRQDGGTLVLRGANLGATPGAGNGNIFATTAPTLVGGGGAAGTTTQSIVPWAIGNLTNPAANTTGNTAANMVGSSLVTYTAANGFRPLATSEYATALGGNATDNVRLTAATTAAASTVNALVFAPAAAATLSGGTINITSGAFLYSPTANVTGTVSASLNFGTAEGVIANTSALALSGAISGSGGVTFYSPTIAATTISGANTYTGTTTLLAAQVSFASSVANDGVTAGPFGLDTSAIVMNAGSGYSLLNASAAGLTFSRNLIIAGPNSPGLDYFGGTAGLIMNGNIDLEHGLTLYGGTSATAPVVYNGVLSGPGGLTGFGSGYYDTFNGNNTFTGGLNAQGDTFTLGSDTALGNGGTIFVSAASTFQGSGTAARTISNPWVFLAGPTFAGTAPLTVSGTINLNGSQTIAVSNTAGTTLTGVISNGAITKTGTGAVAFNSATGNTFTGGFVNTVTAANASAIYANNTSGSAFGTGTVSIGASSATVYSTLAGAFTTSGATSIAGRLSPGNGAGLTPATAGIGSIGQINFGSTLTLSSATTSSMYLEIGGNGASGNFDRITVAGAFTLNGTIYLATANGYTIQAGDTYTLVNYGSLVSGTYSFNTTNASLGAGVTLTETVGANGIVVSAIPEPSTWAAIVAGLGVLGSVQFARRRRS